MIRSCERRKLGNDVVVYSLSRVWLFAAPWIAARQASPSPEICPSSCPLNQWCHSTISSSVIPLFSCLQSFPASGSFPMSIQCWFSLRLTCLISLLSKGLSKVFSSTTVWKHQFFSTQPSLWSNSQHPYMTTGKDHSFDYMDLCWQRDVSAFYCAV